MDTFDCFCQAYTNLKYWFQVLQLWLPNSFEIHSRNDFVAFFFVFLCYFDVVANIASALRHRFVMIFSGDDGCPSPPSETSEDTTSSEEVHSPKIMDDASHDGDGTDQKNSANDDNQPENVLVIDTTFTCKVVAPGIDPFDIKVGCYC